MMDPHGPGGTETILVVDDDDDARRAMSRTLRFHGYTTLEAGDATEGLNVLEESGEGIDLAVVDIVLPEMSGLRLARKIREQHPDAHVLLTSGYADRGVPDGDLPDSATHFLKKPMTIRELVEKVRDVLEWSGADSVDG